MVMLSNAGLMRLRQQLLNYYRRNSMVVVDFSFETPYGKFADSLHLPEDHTFTEAEIEEIKQQRLNDWLAVVSPNTTIETPAQE